jgi:hypothetical protein
MRNILITVMMLITDGGPKWRYGKGRGLLTKGKCSHFAHIRHKQREFICTVTSDTLGNM